MYVERRSKKKDYDDDDESDWSILSLIQHFMLSKNFWTNQKRFNINVNRIIKVSHLPLIQSIKSLSFFNSNIGKYWMNLSFCVAAAHLFLFKSNIKQNENECHFPPTTTEENSKFNVENVWIFRQK